MTFYRIPEKKVEGKPLGRVVHHDSRSKLFPVRSAGPNKSVAWTRRVGPFSQEIGSCTGNGALGALGTDPFFATLPDLPFTEEEATDVIYSLATRLDEFVGQYPPTDTGSSGLGAAKACLQLGLISGYEHAFSLDDVVTGLQTRPGITGVRWYSGMDSPDDDGFVKPTGRVRGGHEFEVSEVSLEEEYFGFWNSWGDWAKGGRFYMRFADYEKLLKQDGDATFFVPRTAPAPTPIVTQTTFVLAGDVAARLDVVAKRHEQTDDQYLDSRLRSMFHMK